jgi:hypothetical protein
LKRAVRAAGKRADISTTAKQHRRDVMVTSSLPRSAASWHRGNIIAAPFKLAIALAVSAFLAALAFTVPAKSQHSGMDHGPGRAVQLQQKEAAHRAR